ncbi:MAG: hypothetical protein V1736_03155 [Pseudomonadota bacterium]
MDMVYFNENHLRIVDDALVLAEQIASDYYKLSSTDWKNAPYDVRTLKDLTSEEIVAGVFAQVARYRQDPAKSPSGRGRYEFYKICLHDHQILKATNGGRGIALFPLLLYVLTHELVHIVRFKRFLHRFHASEQERTGEETRVHRTTSEILRAVPVSGIDPVLRNYEGHAGLFGSGLGGVWTRSDSTEQSIGELQL